MLHFCYMSLATVDALLLGVIFGGRLNTLLNIRFRLGGRDGPVSSGSVVNMAPGRTGAGESTIFRALRHRGWGECDRSDSAPSSSVGFVRDILGGVGKARGSCPFLFAIHLVLEISSRATGSTGTRGWWNAILSHPFQLMSDGMNWSTNSSKLHV